MTTQEQEAKQLDSVTDVVQEQVIDSSKATEAMSALAVGGNNQAATDNSSQQVVAVSKDDVALIVSELEVSEEIATRTLRNVAGDVTEALRQLVTN